MKTVLWIAGGLLGAVVLVPFLWFGFWYLVVSLNEYLRR